jgi:hypothetical protein
MRDPSKVGLGELSNRELEDIITKMSPPRSNKKKNYSSMNVRELKIEAKGKGIPQVYKLKKSELIAALEKLDSDKSKLSSRKKPKKLTKIQIKNIKENKYKVTELKDLLRRLGMPYSGNKDTLRSRLLALE